MTFISSVLKRWLPPKFFAPVIIAIAAVFSVVALILTKFLGILYMIGIIAGATSGIKGWLDPARLVSKMSKKAKLDIAQAATLDPAWDANALENRVREVFTTYQADWSSFNTESMRAYMSPKYWQYNYLMMAAIHLRQRRNQVDDVVISAVQVYNVKDSPGTNQDEVTFYIAASASDKLLDNASGQLLYKDNRPFQELWHFTRSQSAAGGVSNGIWMLDSIDQVTADPLSGDSKVKQLAEQNNFYYALDWGWLLLPSRGDLFKKGSFGKSDINNYMIGVYRDVLIELYSYIDAPDGSNPLSVTVAQAALPKRYDSLIVKAKQKFALFERTPKGYNKLRLEWPDFNKRYNVYATNVEQVTVFELLHPVYMEKLFALPFKVSIEVVDNIVYLYSPDKNADYEIMLNLLKDAFEEMKL